MLRRCNPRDEKHGALTLMWFKTAVATLVWRSISLFFSRSSGRELFREEQVVILLYGSSRGTAVGSMTNSYVKQLFCNMRPVLDEFRLCQDIFHTHNLIKLNFVWEVHFICGIDQQITCYCQQRKSTSLR